MKKRYTLLGLLIAALGLLPVVHSAHAQDTTNWRVTVNVTQFEPTEPLLASLDAFELVELFATETRSQAASVRSFLREPTAIGAESHAAKLTRIRENVNDIARQVERLDRLDVDFLPRQKLALSHIRPHLAVLAASTSSAIETLNADAGELWSTDYETFVTEIYERADGIAEAAHMAESRLNVQDYLDRMSRDSDD